MLEYEKTIQKTFNDISEEIYDQAILTGLEFVKQKNGSASADVIKGLLAAVYDPITSPEIGELCILDIQNQELALKLIIGRLRFGRPAAAKNYRDDLELNFRVISKAKANLPENS